MRYGIQDKCVFFRLTKTVNVTNNKLMDLLLTTRFDIKYTTQINLV